MQNNISIGNVNSGTRRPQQAVSLVSIIYSTRSIHRRKHLVFIISFHLENAIFLRLNINPRYMNLTTCFSHSTFIFNLKKIRSKLGSWNSKIESVCFVFNTYWSFWRSIIAAPSQSSDNQRNSETPDHFPSGRITPPATNLPRFKKYAVTDFNFLKVRFLFVLYSTRVPVSSLRHSFDKILISRGRFSGVLNYEYLIKIQKKKEKNRKKNQHDFISSRQNISIYHSLPRSRWKVRWWNDLALFGVHSVFVDYLNM